MRTMRRIRNAAFLALLVTLASAGQAKLGADSGGYCSWRLDCDRGLYSDPVFVSEQDAINAGEALECDWICYEANCHVDGDYFYGFGCESFCHSDRSHPPNVVGYEDSGAWGFVTGVCSCFDVPEGRH